MVSIKKIWGCAGSGKTTEIMTRIELLKQAYHSNEFIVTAYRKPIADELKARLGWDKEEAPYVGTLHSICLKLLLEEEDEIGIIEEEQKEEFCKSLGLTYKKEGSEKEFLPSADIDNEGNLFFRALDFQTNNSLDCKDIYKYPGIEKLETVCRSPPEAMQNFKTKYISWKKEKCLYDFNDMLQYVYYSKLTPIGAKVLVIDEFQDLTPLQYEIIEMWGEQMNLVIIAGDPRQCIYGFMGADSEFFEKHEGEETILEINHRCSKPIWDFATKILFRAKLNFPTVNTDHDGSKIIRINEDSYYDILSKFKKNAFHLVRINVYGEKVAKALMVAGIPFKGSIMGWQDKEIDLYNAIWKLRLGRIPEPRESEVLTQFFGDMFKTSSDMLWDEGNVLYSELIPGLLIDITKKDDIYSDKIFDSSVGMQETQYSRRTKILSALKNFNEEIQKKEMVSISTIHYAKGLEADTVFLHGRIKKQTYNDLASGYPRIVKEEAQIFHVGSSRARNQLFIVDNNTKYQYPFPLVMS